MLFNGREETEPKRLDVDWWDLRVNLLDLQTMGSCPSKATDELEGHVEYHVALEALAGELNLRRRWCVKYPALRQQRDVVPRQRNSP